MSLIDSTRVERHLQRLGSLVADTPARWGRMDATRMLGHLANSLEIAQGLRQAAPILPAFLFPLARLGGMLPLPIPRGLPSTAEFLAPRDGDFGELRDLVEERLRRFHRAVLGDPLARHLHPAFGPLTRLQWATLQDRHLDHHLRQFGA
jgi:hypothetical protein